MFTWIDTAGCTPCPFPVFLSEHLFFWGKWDKMLFPFLLLRAIPPSKTLHLLTLVMWCWWSCHLKTNSVWPLGSFPRRWRWQSLLQEAAFESAVGGEALVVWYLTAFGFKCEIPGFILDSSCVGGTATRVLEREQNQGEETLTWHKALFIQSRGTNKQTKNTVQNKPHCVTHCLCSEFRISVGFEFSDLKQEITGMPLDSESFFNTLIILTKLAMIWDLTLLISWSFFSSTMALWTGGGDFIQHIFGC